MENFYKIEGLVSQLITDSSVDTATYIEGVTNAVGKANVMAVVVRSNSDYEWRVNLRVIEKMANGDVNRTIAVLETLVKTGV